MITGLLISLAILAAIAATLLAVVLLVQWMRTREDPTAQADRMAAQAARNADTTDWLRSLPTFEAAASPHGPIRTGLVRHRADSGNASVETVSTLGFGGLCIAAGLALILGVVLPSCDGGPRPNAGAPVFAEQPAVLASATIEATCDTIARHADYGRPYAERHLVALDITRSGLTADAIQAAYDAKDDVAWIDATVDVQAECVVRGWQG